jgi:hypothetical protein
VHLPFLFRIAPDDCGSPLRFVRVLLLVCPVLSWPCLCFAVCCAVRALAKIDQTSIDGGRWHIPSSRRLNKNEKATGKWT